MISGNKSLSDLFAELANNVQQEQEKITRAGLFDLNALIVERSPVDTGRFRANWLAALHKPRRYYVNSKREPKLGVRLIDEAVREGYKYYFHNNLPYARVIEYGLYPSPVKRGTWNKQKKVYERRSSGGFSKQARSGVVRISVLEYTRILREKIKKVRT